MIIPKEENEIRAVMKNVGSQAHLVGAGQLQTGASKGILKDGRFRQVG